MIFYPYQLTCAILLFCHKSIFEGGEKWDLFGYPSATHYLFNKLTSVFYESVRLLIMSFVITLSK